MTSGVNLKMHMCNKYFLARSLALSTLSHGSTTAT
jgi:hypothetical protein